MCFFIFTSFLRAVSGLFYFFVFFRGNNLDLNIMQFLFLKILGNLELEDSELSDCGPGNNYRTRLHHDWPPFFFFEIICCPISSLVLKILLLLVKWLCISFRLLSCPKLCSSSFRLFSGRKLCSLLWFELRMWFLRIWFLPSH